MKAADGGTVIYAGSDVAHLGNLLLVQHQGGYITAYGNNEALLVKKGDAVKKGQTIAKAGNSGGVASPRAALRGPPRRQQDDRSDDGAAGAVTLSSQTKCNTSLGCCDGETLRPTQPGRAVQDCRASPSRPVAPPNRAALDRSASSISRELRRNRGVQVGYKPTYAHQRAAARRWKGSRLERNAELRDLVLDRLKRGWSPEQIAGWLAAPRPRAGSVTRASTGSSTIRSGAPMTALGAITCPEPKACGADATGPVDTLSASQRPRFHRFAPARGSAPTHLRTLGSRPHAVHRPRPGPPRVART